LWRLFDFVAEPQGGKIRKGTSHRAAMARIFGNMAKGEKVQSDPPCGPFGQALHLNPGWASERGNSHPFLQSQKPKAKKVAVSGEAAGRKRRRRRRR
jgi:hypothetical protein